MKTIFPGNSIAKELQLCPERLKYVVNHVLKSEVLKSPYLVVLFDESLNKSTHKSAQQSEMDLLVRFWDDTNKSVKVRYWNSMFLGHTTHVDLMNSFEVGLKDFDVAKLTQISMDVPNTNWLFLKMIKNRK